MASPVVGEVVEATLAAAVGQASPVAVAAVVVARAEVVGVVAEVAEPVQAEVVLVQHPARADDERAPQVWASSLFSLPLVMR